jgi:nitrate reductase gamma subunit
MAMTTALYTATIIFLAGIAIRVFRMHAMPMHVRWELYPIPDGVLRQTKFMLSEILLFKGLFDHNRSLWIGSWIFHLALYLLAALAVIALAAASITAAPGILISVIKVLAPTSFALGTVGGAILILMRIGSRKLRTFTTAADILNLSLLLVLFASGLICTWTRPEASSLMVSQAGALLQMNPAPPLAPAAWIHLGCIAVFIAYFPFTPMAHAFLKYYTYHSVRWDDRPAASINGVTSRMRQYLALPIGWAAPHVRKGAGHARWADVLEDNAPDHEEGEQG